MHHRTINCLLCNLYWCRLLCLQSELLISYLFDSFITLALSQINWKMAFCCYLFGLRFFVLSAVSSDLGAHSKLYWAAAGNCFFIFYRFVKHPLAPRVLNEKQVIDKLARSCR